jgi:serine/threonine protein phosphatase 1
VRTLVVGDIHGCYAELQALLTVAGYTDADRLISVGDVVNRGPDSLASFAFIAGDDRHRAVRGNHEHKHIQARLGDFAPTLSMLMTRWQMGGEYNRAVDWMQALPIYIDLPEAIIVHGYYEPGYTLYQQAGNILVGTDGAGRHLRVNYDRPWWELYDGAKPIIVGHKDMSGKQKPFNYRDRVYGLDTGCVYGGSLTGLWLPDFEFVSVPADRPYWQDMQSDLLPPS